MTFRPMENVMWRELALVRGFSAGSESSRYREPEVCLSGRCEFFWRN